MFKPFFIWDFFILEENFIDKNFFSYFLLLKLLIQIAKGKDFRIFVFRFLFLFLVDGKRTRPTKTLCQKEVFDSFFFCGKNHLKQKS